MEHDALSEVTMTGAAAQLVDVPCHYLAMGRAVGVGGEANWADHVNKDPITSTILANHDDCKHSFPALTLTQTSLTSW